MRTPGKGLRLSACHLLALGLVGAIPAVTAGSSNDTTSRPLAYTGVNLAGADFDPPKRGTPSVFGKDYTYPTAEEFAHFSARGMNVFRLPFLWERLQPTLKAPFERRELERLETAVKRGLQAGGTVLLDPHNYARYFGKVIGGPEVSDADFADFWERLAARFKDSPHVWFGLMNEPHDLPNAQWLGAANAAIAAIRKTGARNLILVPGNSWTGAHSWAGSGNAETMLRVVDPADHYVFDVHQYLDKDSSGTHAQVVSPTIGSERLRGFTAWCRKHHKRAFLGEFAAAANPAGQAAVGDMIGYMEANADVWTGFAWWAAGPWWGDYMYSLEPKNGRDRPQMDWLRPHLQAAPPARGGGNSPLR